MNKEELLKLIDYKCPLCKSSFDKNIQIECGNSAHRFKLFFSDWRYEDDISHIYLNTIKYYTTLNIRNSSEGFAHTLDIYLTGMERTMSIKVDPAIILKLSLSLSLEDFEKKITTLITFS